MTDFFDGLLSLEEDFYAEGHALGVSDGAVAGRTEGRVFGLEKGFDKFLELGRLQGRSSIWNARISPVPGSPAEKTAKILTNSRAARNIQALELLLTHPPFKNDEETVEEVEETLKRGRVKAKVLERMLGEKEEKAAEGRVGGGEQNIEDLGKGRTIVDL